MAHRSSFGSDRSDSRPTLPPIRDLFRDELSRQREAPSQDSPSLPFAQLHVADDGDRTLSSLKMYRESRHKTQRTYGLPGPSEYFEPPAHSHPSASTRMPLSFYTPGRLDYSLSHPSLPTDNHWSPYASRGDINIARNPPHHETQGRPPLLHPQAATPLAYQSHVSPRTHHSYNTSDPVIARHRSTSILTDTRMSQSAWNISTASSAQYMTEDDERTPVAHFHNSAGIGLVNIPHADVHQLPDDNLGGSASKYDCPHCGKGFNRPSSLKIHLNSHTGEKPFVCPVESCGRSFSVLSNMRRHARVHIVPSDQEPPSGDGPIPSVSTTRMHMRRRSSTSSSSASGISRRSRSISSNDDQLDEWEAHTEKRLRRNIA